MRSREALAALVIIIAAPVVAYQPRQPDELAWVAVPVPRASVDDEHRLLGSVPPVPRIPQSPASRPIVVIPTAPVIVVAIDASERGGLERLVQGVSSWFCGHGSACTRGYPGGLYAAAGPLLRVGNWRGRRVVVEAGGRRVVVVLIDWCACPHRLLDLYSDAFQRLAPLSRGLVKVTVSW